MVGSISGVSDAGDAIAGLEDDIDLQSRFFDEGVDIDADEKDLSSNSSSTKSILGSTYLLLLN